MRTLLTFLLFLLTIAPAMAQVGSAPAVSKKAQKFFDDSQEALTWDRYTEAEKLLLKAVETEPKYVQAWERLGYLYIKTKEFKKSYEAFQQVATIAPDYSREIWYYLAKDALAAQKFDSVAILVQQYRRVGRFNEKREVELKALEANLQFAKEAIKHPVPFNPVCLDSSINTTGDEYFATLTADTGYLYFSRHVKDAAGRFGEELILYCKNENGKWSKPKSIGDNINDPKSNQGAHSISPDGMTLYFTVCRKAGGYGGCDIYYVTKQGANTWSDPINIGPAINTSYREAQPCISGDGKTLYFVSDRPGGLGDWDIWYSNLQTNGEWGKPINMGSSINSAGIDDRPYIHPDGETLYFSSEGRPGFGEADLYYSRKQPDGKWSEAENMGWPINSYNREEGIYITRDGNTGYYATDRYGKTGDLDICTFQVPEAAKPHPVTYVRGLVTDVTTTKPLAVMLEFVDVNTGVVINRKQSSSFDGSYLVTLPYGREYAVNILQKGYLFYSQHFSLIAVKAGDTYQKDIALASITNGSTVVLNNIFFESKSFELKKESMVELNKLVEFLQNNPSVKMEIQGHTDNVGTAASNLELSNNRAKSVLEYLVKAGIDKSRLTSKGYGETRPVMPNDTEEGRARNRRTEFKVTGV